MKGTPRTSLTNQPPRPISPRAKICQIVPTTFQGISKGSATSTSASDAVQPRAGMASAIAMPKGIWMRRMVPEKINWRKKAPCRSCERKVCLNHSVPTQ